MKQFFLLFYLTFLFNYTIMVQAQGNCDHSSNLSCKSQVEKLNSILSRGQNIDSENLMFPNPICIPEQKQYGYKTDQNDEIIKTKDGQPIKEPREIQLNNQMKTLSDDEVAIRLIFAETLASNCVDIEALNATAQAVAAVINNRIYNANNKYGKGIRGVVFKESQFASSTGGCDDARRTEFLCPMSSKKTLEELKLEQTVWEYANQAFKNAKAGMFKEQYTAGTNHYFFKNHFITQSSSCYKWHGKPPMWHNQEGLTVKEITGQGIINPDDRTKTKRTSCVTVYKGVK